MDLDDLGGEHLLGDLESGHGLKELLIDLGSSMFR